MLAMQLLQEESRVAVVEVQREVDLGTVLVDRVGTVVNVVPTYRRYIMYLVDFL